MDEELLSPAAVIDDSDDQDLLSLSRSPSERTIALGVEETDDLLSVTSSPLREENEAEDHSGRPMPGSSSNSIEGNQVIRRFKQRVDENGETVYEFAPAGEDMDSESDDEDYYPPGYPIMNLGENEMNTAPVAARVAARARSRGRPRNQNSMQPQLSRQARIVRKRKKTRKAKKLKKKKIAVVKERKPPRPLKPQVVLVKVNEDDFFPTNHRFKTVVNIDVDVMKSSATEETGFKVGEAYLKMNDDSSSFRNLEELKRQLPGLKDFILIQIGLDDLVVRLVTEESFTKEEFAATGISEPKSKGKKDSNRSVIYLVQKSYNYICTVQGLPQKIFNSQGLGSKKNFRLDFIGINDENMVQLDIFVWKDSVLGFHDIKDLPYRTTTNQLSEAYSAVFNISGCPISGDLQSNNDNSHPKELKEDIGWFYAQVKKYHDRENLPAVEFSLQPDCLIPILRPYQRRAVHWMLYREKVLKSDSVFRVNLVDAFLEKMYYPVSLGGNAAFFNPYVGYICWVLPQLNTPSGGILADEMGLGKTVETICLIVLNPRPENEYQSIIMPAKNEQVLEVSNDSPKSQKSFSENQSSISSESEEDSESEVFNRNVRRARKRKIVKKSDGNSSSSSTGHKTKQSRRMTVITSSDSDIDEIETEEVNVNERSPAVIGSSSKSTTYECLKARYDLELLKYADNSKNTVKFHGTFFDTKIFKKPCFACICGDTRTKRKKIILQCAVCHSSQHAECVGFDNALRKFYFRIKKKYICPHCTVLEPPFPSKTTLIVTPATICDQWKAEINRHWKKNESLTILFYEGISKHGYIPPEKIAEYDLVITTYSVLSSELNYVDLPHTNSEDGLKFRNPKRFMTTPSPLPAISFWRVCLDEAQLVESSLSKTSLMTRKLPAAHRWAITGTPINGGLQDLYGLFAFLGTEPINLEYWWQKLVQEPFFNKSYEDVALLHEIFGQFIWRNGKIDVLDQLGIPPQTSLEKWIRFSAVEEHFYKQQLEICSKNLIEKIDKLQKEKQHLNVLSNLSILDRQTLQSVLAPFLELRKACCHPQIVKGQTLSLEKGPMTMEELLAQLIKKSSLQCADDHRIIVASLNGMAGIHMIKEEWFAASEKYRQVLQSASSNKEHFTTDSLQLLHTMENLADLLDRNHDGIPYTLRDSSLRSDAEELKHKYLDKYSNGVKTALLAVEPLTKLTEELSCQFKFRTTWWLFALQKATMLGKADEFIKRIKEELLEVRKKVSSVVSLADKFNDISGLELILVEQTEKIKEMRKHALEGLDQLQQKDPSSFVHAAASCHLRKKSQYYYKDTDEIGFRCQICLYHDRFIEYESILFKEEKKQKVIRTGRKWQQQKIMGEISTELTEEERNLVLIKEEEELFESLEHVNICISEELRRGTWGDSDTERILKLINNFARINRLHEVVREDGSTHIKLFEAMKKEFRMLRVLWRQIYDQISAIDELSQATTRLCLKYNNGMNVAEPSADNQAPNTSTGSSKRKNKPKELKQTQLEQDQRIQNIYLLERHELGTKMMQMQAELAEAEVELSTHKGQLLYLETLKKNKVEFSNDGKDNSEECPVCQSVLGQKWSALRCGHSFCTDCVNTMCGKFNKNFLCPLCRESMKSSDVNSVTTISIKETSLDSDTNRSAAKYKIKGSQSTKVFAILSELFLLQESHAGEKVIIFSTWSDVLEIIAKALQQNDISYCLLTQTGKKFQSELNRFKTVEDIQVLLMPLASGSKGLNIIEATHVFLVEPVINRASELQAIGRIHRIGQIKPTFVHRFYILNTVEEKLYELLKTHDVTSDNEGLLTIAELKKLVQVDPNKLNPGSSN